MEENLRNIREENSEPAILSLAGVIDEAEAEVMTNAVEESRKQSHFIDSHPVSL